MVRTWRLEAEEGTVDGGDTMAPISNVIRSGRSVLETTTPPGELGTTYSRAIRNKMFNWQCIS